MKTIALKVCGMRNAENIIALAALVPQYIGFIFYEKSPRFVKDNLEKENLDKLPGSIQKVGVFVNASTDTIDGLCRKYGIKIVQLHGDETPAQCQELKELGYTVIKAFSIGESFDFNLLNPFTAMCDFFLFDTKSLAYGGTGKSFNWEILKDYNNALPIFLSGGIDPSNIERLQDLEHLNIHAVDVNSRFEISPGLKDISKLKLFKEQLNAIVHK